MYIFIINPMSGYGKASVSWDKPGKLIIEQQIPYTSLTRISEIETNEFIDKQLQLTNIKAIAIIGGDDTTSSISSYEWSLCLLQLESVRSE